MAIQELSRAEVSVVSGGAGLVNTVLTLVGRIATTPLVTNLLSTVTRLTRGLLSGLRL